MEYDKPFKTYPQLITHLRDEYGMTICDEDFAISCMENLSYYDLINGYQDVFLDNHGLYPNGINFEYLYTFHDFDRSFQNILFKYSVLIETRFKSIFSYMLSERYGEHTDLYLNPANYTPRRNSDEIEEFEKVMLEIDKCMNGDYIDNPTKFYKENHNHIPAWILFKNVNWGTCCDLYGFLKPDDKDFIVSRMVNIKCDEAYKKTFLPKALKIIRKFRNTIAHNSKFISFLTPYSSSIMLKDLCDEYKGTIIKGSDFNNPNKGRDAFSLILCILSLLNDKYKTIRFMSDLNYVYSSQINLPKNYQIWDNYCSATGIPIDLIDRFEKYIKTNQDRPSPLPRQ